MVMYKVIFRLLHQTFRYPIYPFGYICPQFWSTDFCSIGLGGRATFLNLGKLGQLFTMSFVHLAISVNL